MRWRRIPLGPPVFVPVVDAEALAGRWREAHPADLAPRPAPERRRPERRRPERRRPELRHRILRRSVLP